MLAPDPVARPLEDVAGDIRDRLTVLVNAAQVIRLSVPADDARMQSVLRQIVQQIESLGRLADELCRCRRPADGEAHPGT